MLLSTVDQLDCQSRSVDSSLIGILLRHNQLQPLKAAPQRALWEDFRFDAIANQDDDDDDVDRCLCKLSISRRRRLTQ